jgi:predicted metal-dependent phosphotriesterase family hydrolase
MISNPQVPTVRGPVAVHDLGTTLMHEHVFVLSEEFRPSLPGTGDEQQRIDDAVTRLNALAATGVSTIVDPDGHRAGPRRRPGRRGEPARRPQHRRRHRRLHPR